ncbi:hypothetical protein [Streptomyces albireticuli]|uniref:hypothetical protein n=1 Tax=Streptomyces albireticuli TaxID=1940 RepID=UPI001F3A067A|nr:hypothetical protein [Streptomyces albireticuli]
MIGCAPAADCTTSAADTIRSRSTSTPVVSVSNAVSGPSNQHMSQLLALARGLA